MNLGTPSLPIWFDDSAANDWRAYAYCQTANPELFFPNAGTLVTAALEYCARCPVTQECLHYALQYPQTLQHGIYGGTTAKHRTRLIAERNQTNDKTESHPA